MMYYLLQKKRFISVTGKEFYNVINDLKENLSLKCSSKDNYVYYYYNFTDGSKYLVGYRTIC